MSSLTPEALIAAYESLQKIQNYIQPIYLSPRAHGMTLKIKDIDPSFNPSCEYHVWFKASELGLMKVDNV